MADKPPGYRLKPGTKLTAALERFLELERPEVAFAVRGMDLTVGASARLIIDGVKAHILMIEVSRLITTDDIADHLNSANPADLARYIVEGATIALAQKKEEPN